MKKTKKELELENVKLKKDLDLARKIMDEYAEEKQKVQSLIREQARLAPNYEHKRMNDINTFQAHENEVYLRGTDECGKDFTLLFDSYNFLEWIDKEQLDYIKEQLTKYIQEK